MTDKNEATIIGFDGVVSNDHQHDHQHDHYITGATITTDHNDKTIDGTIITDDHPDGLVPANNNCLTHDIRNNEVQIENDNTDQIDNDSNYDSLAFEVNKYRREIDQLKQELVSLKLDFEKLKLKNNDYRIQCDREIDKERLKNVLQIRTLESENSDYQHKLRTVVWGYQVYRKLYEIRYIELNEYRKGWYIIYQLAANYANIDKQDSVKELHKRYDADLFIFDEINNYIDHIDQIMNIQQIHQELIDNEYISNDIFLKELDQKIKIHIVEVEEGTAKLSEYIKSQSYCIMRSTPQYM